MNADGPQIAVSSWGIACPLALLVVAFVIGLMVSRSANNRSHRNHATRSFLIIGFLVGLPLMLVLISLLAYSRTVVSPGLPAIPNEATEVRMYPDTSAIAAVQLPSPSVDWTSVDLTSFQADAYPNIVDTAAPLARKIRAELEVNRLLPSTSVGGVNQPPTIQVFTSKLDGPHSADVIQAFLAEVRLRFEQGTISLQGPSVTLSNDQVFGNTIALVLSKRQELRVSSPWDKGNWLYSGELQCEAITSLGKTLAFVKYTDQTWVETFGQFASERPKKRFIAGYSSSLASSENNAKQAALNDANEKLHRSGFMHFELAEAVATDQFVQKLSRPYGDVWRAALLFDLSSPTVANFAVATMRERVDEQIRSRTTVFGILILFTLTAVLCVVLNWLTLGYYCNQVGFGWLIATVGVVVLGLLVMS